MRPRSFRSASLRLHTLEDRSQPAVWPRLAAIESGPLLHPLVIPQVVDATVHMSMAASQGQLADTARSSKGLPQFADGVGHAEKDVRIGRISTDLADRQEALREWRVFTDEHSIEEIVEHHRMLVPARSPGKAHESEAEAQSPPVQSLPVHVMKEPRTDSEVVRTLRRMPPASNVGTPMAGFLVAPVPMIVPIEEFAAVPSESPPGEGDDSVDPTLEKPEVGPHNAEPAHLAESNWLPVPGNPQFDFRALNEAARSLLDRLAGFALDLDTEQDSVSKILWSLAAVFLAGSGGWSISAEWRKLFRERPWEPHHVKWTPVGRE